jgi:hypothetical protein
MNKIDQYLELCKGRVEVLTDAVATRSTSYVLTGSGADQRAAHQAIIELNAWREALKHYEAVFEL